MDRSEGEMSGTSTLAPDTVKDEFVRTPANSFLRYHEVRPNTIASSDNTIVPKDGTRELLSHRMCPLSVSTTATTIGTSEANKHSVEIQHHHLIGHQEEQNQTIGGTSVEFETSSDARRISESPLHGDKTGHLRMGKEAQDKAHAAPILETSSFSRTFTEQTMAKEESTGALAFKTTNHKAENGAPPCVEKLDLSEARDVMRTTDRAKEPTKNKKYNFNLHHHHHHNDDALSSASTASATTMSPTADPVFLDDTSGVPPARLPSAIATRFTQATDDETLSDDEYVSEKTPPRQESSIRGDERPRQAPPDFKRIHHRDRTLQPRQPDHPTHQRMGSWGETDRFCAPVTFPAARHQSQEKRHFSSKGGAWTGATRTASFRNEPGAHPARNQQRGLVPTSAWGQSQRSSIFHGHVLRPHAGHYPPTASGHVTPPRVRSSRQTHSPHNHSSPAHVNVQSGRSASELLKTLLRKKACLYEPGTSRAIALTTWLVGRELALEFGYFSRQQLQSGVHATVAKKIDSNIITRTKVNRCMQVTLNSCFHYIIPRPDGTEENGKSFKKLFAESVCDDSDLCATLPEPWNDLIVQRDVVLNTQEGESRSGQPAKPSPTSPTRNSFGHDGDHGNKRAVLLCFNENVRSADDVFRCHHEFIRDTANSAQLQLTQQEWDAFFGPMSTVDETVKDNLGRLGKNDLAMFRTTWCSKRYDHDHDLCGFAHVEVNGGWLRRNPMTHNYSNQMCPAIVPVSERRTGKTCFMVNECEKGSACRYCHSEEEVLYHPSNYKLKVCKNAGQACRFGDVCPHLHPPPDRPQQCSKKLNTVESRQRHGKAASPVAPSGAPMLYVHPAPPSSFDRYLLLPGLQNLFRRQSSVIKASMTKPVGRSLYSQFGDDWGIVGG